MVGSRPRRPLALTDTQLLLLLATGRFLFHLLTNGQYGFHQDALAFLANGQTLAWGYVEYPPLTPALGRLGLELFGLSLVGIKGLAALAQCIAMVVTSLMARALGGGRRAQLLAAVAAGIGLMSLIMSTLFQYITFEYLWLVLLFYCLLRLLKSDDSRWWLGVGLFLGLAVMTKYTAAFYAVALVGTVLGSRLRRQLTSRWLWLGALLALIVILPNLLWQLQHDFVSLEFLTAISSRDRLLGRADGFFSQQLYVNVNPLMLPLVGLGGYYLYAKRDGRFRPVLLFFSLTLLLFAAARGRFYYTAALYPMLIAAGAVQLESHWQAAPAFRQRLLRWAVPVCLAIGGALGAALMLPLAPVNSSLWGITSQVHDNFLDEIGWEELAATTATSYQTQHAVYPNLAIMAAHYGAAAAIQLYSPRYNLPPVLSPVNSFWYRGLEQPPPAAVLTLGFAREELAPLFISCQQVGMVSNAYGITRIRPEIYLCAEPQQPWTKLWASLMRYS